MAYSGDDDDGDDFAFFALVAAGVYFFWQLYRDQLAAAQGGGYFDAAPPASDPTSGILNILVPLQLSPTGAAFIKKQEGFRASPYPDGKGKYSIYYGHQIQPGETFDGTRAEGEKYFARDAAAAAQAVSDGVKVEVTQNQFDALVSLAFTIGRAGFLKSSLLASLNAGDYAGAAAQFGAYIHSGGVVSKDLQARRKAEQQLFGQG